MGINVALAELAARYWTFQCEEIPINAIAAGVTTDATQLMREAPADHERRAAWARTALDELATIDIKPLGVDDKATHRLLDHELRLLVEMVESGAHSK